MHSFMAALGVIRVPLLVSIFSTIVFLIPSQFREIYHAIWRESMVGRYSGLVISSLFVLFFSFAIFMTGKLLIISSSSLGKKEVDTYAMQLQGILAIATILPISGIALNCIIPIAEDKIKQYNTINYENNSTAAHISLLGWIEVEWIIYFLLFAFFIIIYLFVIFSVRIKALTCIADKSLSYLLTKTGLSYCILLVSVIAFLLIVSIARFPLIISQTTGPLGITCLFFMIVLAFTALLSFLYDRDGIPIIFLLFCVAGLLARFEINNNHYVRTLVVHDDDKDLAVDFRSWVSSRPDLPYYQGKPYPVFLVTAEGGGLYAAAHTAFTLSHIQDSCPSFARHVFAISGVSGGSLGAGLFASLVKASSNIDNKVAPQTLDGNVVVCGKDSTESGKYFQLSKNFLRTDFLSPLLAMGLFPDFFQRFWPWCIPNYDRALGLEKGFEQAWQNSTAQTNSHFALLENPFAADFKKLWTPKGDVPSLLLNATLVHTGGRAIIAPYRLQGRGEKFFADTDIDIVHFGPSMRLSTAVGISARFPILSPAGVFKPLGDIPEVQLVDGGYYENAGTETIRSLIERLRVSFKNDQLPPNFGQDNRQGCSPSNLVLLQMADGSPTQICLKVIVIKTESPTEFPSLSGEILTPVRAMLNTRNGRGFISRKSLYNDFCGDELCEQDRPNVRPHVYRENLDVSGVPLGWFISTSTLDLINMRLGNYKRCRLLGNDKSSDNTRPPGMSANKWRVILENDCLYFRIRQDLIGELL